MRVKWPIQIAKKRKTLEDGTRTSRSRKKTKGSGKHENSRLGNLQITKPLSQKEKASRGKNFGETETAEKEGMVGFDSNSRSTTKGRDAKDRKKALVYTNETPKFTAQQPSPPESNLTSIEDQQEVSPLRSRSLSCLQSQLETNNQLDSPMSMPSPCTLNSESSKSLGEAMTRARAMLEIPLPELQSPSAMDHVEMASAYFIDNPPSSCGYPFLNDLKEPTSPAEVCSKYFANHEVSTQKTITEFFSNPGSCDGESSKPSSPKITLDQPATCGSVCDDSKTKSKKIRKEPAKARKRPKVVSGVSKYFPISKAAAGSCLPFPSLRRNTFGLVQETLAHDPFRLLMATIYLNRTKGHVAIPVMKEFFEKYPTVESVAEAGLEDIATILRPLGLHNQRAGKLISLAKTWLSHPPVGGKRYRKLDYPKKKDGRDIMADECLDDDDPRVAWEIAHLPGIGPYAIDSWRIFCRDELRGHAKDWKGTGAAEGFIPEWKSVLPQDKELRAYISWMWLKEGYSWDMETGKVTPAKKPRKHSTKKKAPIIPEDALDLGTETRSAILENFPDPSPSLGLNDEI